MDFPGKIAQLIILNYGKSALIQELDILKQCPSVEMMLLKHDELQQNILEKNLIFYYVVSKT